MGKIERIQVPPEDRQRLVRLVKDRNTPQKIVWRSQIVLLAGADIGAVEVATRVGKSVLTVRRWRRRCAANGVDGLLKDATRPPGRKPLTARKIKQVVNLTLNEKPPDATHWSERTMAARAGIAPSSVHKIWAAHGLKPHRRKPSSSRAIRTSSPRSRRLSEAEELAMPVARHAFADDGAVEHVESREQGRGAVALVVMRHRPAAALLHRQPRLGAIKGLDLALFIDRQHQGLVGRINRSRDPIARLCATFIKTRPHVPRRCCSKASSTHSTTAFSGGEI